MSAARLFLEVTTGPATGSVGILRPGDPCRIGRSGSAELSFPDDPYLSPQHCAVVFDGMEARLYDLQSENGTFVNEQRQLHTTLKSGDRIVAGTTELLLTSAFEPFRASPLARLAASLRDATAGRKLMAILDGAEGDNVHEFLSRSGQRSQSLYQGRQQEELGRASPYLVEFDRELEPLVWALRSFWGTSTMLFLGGADSFEEVRRQFRQFLLVELPDGKTAYFRFYDPRVLQTYLPTCSSEEAARWFQHAQWYACEGEPGTIRFYDFRENSVRESKVSFRVPDPRVRSLQA